MPAEGKKPDPKSVSKKLAEILDKDSGHRVSRRSSRNENGSTASSKKPEALSTGGQKKSSSGNSRERVPTTWNLSEKEVKEYESARALMEKLEKQPAVQTYINIREDPALKEYLKVVRIVEAYDGRTRGSSAIPIPQRPSQKTRPPAPIISEDRKAADNLVVDSDSSDPGMLFEMSVGRADYERAKKRRVEKAENKAREAREAKARESEEAEATQAKEQERKKLTFSKRFEKEQADDRRRNRTTRGQSSRRAGSTHSSGGE